MQATYRRALQPDNAAQHAHWDRQLAAGVLPDAVRWTNTHAADRHAAPPSSGTVAACADVTEMLQGAEYFSFGCGNVIATSGDDKHWTFIAFVKKN